MLLWHTGDAVSHDADIRGGTAKGMDMKTFTRHRLVRVSLAGGLALCLSGIAVNAGTASASTLKTTLTVPFTDGTIDTGGSVSLTAIGHYTDGTQGDIAIAGTIATGSGLGRSKAKVTNAAVLAGAGIDTSGNFSIPFTTTGTKQVITGTIDGVVPTLTENGSLTQYKLKSVAITCAGAYPPLTFGCSAGFDWEATAELKR